MNINFRYCKKCKAPYDIQLYYDWCPKCRSKTPWKNKVDNSQTISTQLNRSKSNKIWDVENHAK